LRKPPLSSASRPSRAGVALMSISWATVSGRMNSPGGELAGDDELPHVRGRLVAEPGRRLRRAGSPTVVGFAAFIGPAHLA